MAFFEPGGAPPPEAVLDGACAPWCDTVVVAQPRGALKTLRGAGSIVERLGGFEFEIGPRTFFQTNTVQAERLYGLIETLARGVAPRRALDLYAGVGTIAAFLSRAAEEVVAVEAVEASVRAGTENLRRNGIGGARMLRGDAGRIAAEALGRTFDLVVADPPRAGLDAGARALLDRLGAPHLLYVSCNPATLARDLVPLLAAGRRIAAVQPLDMFPHAFHVETLVHLVRA